MTAPVTTAAALRRSADVPATPESSRTPVAAVLVVGLVAAIVSAAGSWIPSYWGDEAATVLSATRPLGSLVEMLGHVDAVHGVYYLAMHAWADIVGTSPFAMRLPSAVAIGVAAGGVVWLCHRLVSLRLAIAAGLVTAILPRVTVIGEEARSYAMTVAIAALLWLVVVEIGRRNDVRRGWWIAFAMLLAAGIWVFAFFALLIPAVAVVVLTTPSLRRRWRAWSLSIASGVLVSTPILVMAYLQRGQVGFLDRRDYATPWIVVVEMWFRQGPVFAFLAWTLIVAGVVAALLPGASRSIRSLTLLGVAWMVVPVGILLAVAPWVAVYSPRYGALSLPAVGILVALGIRAFAVLGRRLVTRRAIAIGVTAALLVAAVPVWVGQRTPHSKDGSDWNDIAALIQERAIAGDGVVFDEANRYSRRTRLAMSTNPAAFAATRDVTLAVPYTQSTGWHDLAYSVAEAAALGRFDGVDRVWVVEYATEEGPVSRWGLDDLAALGFRVTDRTALHRSVVYLLQR